MPSLSACPCPEQIISCLHLHLTYALKTDVNKGAAWVGSKDQCLPVFPAIVTGVERRRQCRENVRPQVKDKSAQAPAKGSPWDKGVIWIFPPWFKVPRATWVPPAVNVCSRVVLLLGSPCLSPQTANTMGVKQKQPSETCRKWNFYSRLKASANTFIVSHLCDWGQTKTGSNPRLLS